jgi:predicted transcriptional regulator
MTEKKESMDITFLVAQIVSGYVSKNTINSSEIPSFIEQVHRSLTEVGKSNSYIQHGRMTPAVPINESIQSDYIICLEDGRRMKMLKRYLRTVYHLSPDQYRERWGLPNDYPMVAPNYAKKRSRLARDIGLGKGNMI